MGDTPDNPGRQVLSCHRLVGVWPRSGLAAVRANGKVIAAVADVAQVHELDLGSAQEFFDDGLGLASVRDQHAVRDPTPPVVGPDDLLAMESSGGYSAGVR